jgi:PhnB protein
MHISCAWTEAESNRSVSIGAHGTLRSMTNQDVKISAMLSVRNGSQAIDFYKAAFGAEELFRLEDNGSVVAQLSIGKSDFWLADESPEHFNFSPQTLGGGSVRMVLTVDEPDRLFDQAISAGATTIWPVEDKDYGWRMGRLVDPFGHHWEIGKPL